MSDYYDEDCDCDTPAQAVRDWLTAERCKPGGLTPEEIALLERCAEDLE